MFCCRRLPSYHFIFLSGLFWDWSSTLLFSTPCICTCWNKPKFDQNFFPHLGTVMHTGTITCEQCVLWQICAGSCVEQWARMWFFGLCRTYSCWSVLTPLCSYHSLWCCPLWEVFVLMYYLHFCVDILVLQTRLRQCYHYIKGSCVTRKEEDFLACVIVTDHC